MFDSPDTLCYYHWPCHRLTSSELQTCCWRRSTEVLAPAEPVWARFHLGTI